MLIKFFYIFFIFFFACKDYSFFLNKKKRSSENVFMISAELEVLEINGKPSNLFISEENSFFLEPGEHEIIVTMAKQKNKLKAGTMIQRDFVQDISQKQIISFEAKKGETVFLCPNIDFHMGVWFPFAEKPLYFKTSRHQKYPDSCFGYDSYWEHSSRENEVYILNFKKDEVNLNPEDHKKVLDSYSCALEEAEEKTKCVSRIYTSGDISNKGKLRSESIKEFLRKNSIDVKDLKAGGDYELDEESFGRSYFYLGYNPNCKIKKPEINCLKGDCKNNYSILKDDKRRTYEGEFKDGFAHGNGKRKTVKCKELEMEEEGEFEDGWLEEGIKKINYYSYEKIEEGKFLGEKLFSGISYKKNFIEKEITEFSISEEGKETISIKQDESSGEKMIRKLFTNKAELLYISNDGKQWSL